MTPGSMRGKVSKTTPLINNFNGGELSPKLDARSDINKYYSGCRTLQNMVPLVEGGAVRMPGTYYVAQSMYEDVTPRTTRLVPFHFSTTQGYILEFSYHLIRFYKDDGQIAVDTSMDDFDPTDSYYINEHTKVGATWRFTWNTPTRRLYISAPYGLTITGISIDVQVNTGDTLSVTDVANTITIKLANTDGAKNKASLIQAAVRALGTVNSISVAAWTVTEDIAYAADRPHSADDSATSSASNYLYRCLAAVTGNTSNGSYHPTEAGSAFWQEVTLAGYVYVSTTYADAEVFDLKFCQSADVLYIFHPSHAPAKLERYSHINWKLTDLLTTNGESKNVTDVNKATQAKVVTATNHGFKVGDMVYFSGITGMTELNGNTYKVSRKISKTVFTIDCDSTAFTTFTDDAGASVIRRIFYAANKYPSCGCFFEQRLCVAGSNDNPTTVDMSVVSDYENFDKDPDEDDYAVQYTLVGSGSARVDRIRWLAGQDFLMIGTAGGVWKVGATDSNEPLTQANVSAKKQVGIGVQNIESQDVVDGVLFTPRSSLNVRKLAYSFEADRWIAHDMTRLAEHICKGTTLLLSGIKQTALMQDPFPIFLAVRNDGQLIGMTYETQEEVYAWFRINFDGDIKSVAVLSRDGNEDEIWIVIDRTISAATWRSIEYFKPFNFFSVIANAFYVEGGITYATGNAAKAISGITQANPAVVTANSHGFSNGDVIVIYGVGGMTEVNKTAPYTSVYTVVAATTHTFALTGIDSRTYSAYTSGGYAIKVNAAITGLGHLEGKSVASLIDGYVGAAKTVSSGGITTTYYGNTFQVGLPYDSIVEPMKLHSGSKLGTARGKKQRVNKLTCCFYETGNGVEAGPDSTKLLDVQELTAGSLNTVDAQFEFGGDWDEEATVYIKQSDPLPMTILALVPDLSMNE